MYARRDKHSNTVFTIVDVNLTPLNELLIKIKSSGCGCEENIKRSGTNDTLANNTDDTWECNDMGARD